MSTIPELKTEAVNTKKPEHSIETEPQFNININITE